MGPVPAADTRRLAPGVHTSPGTGYAAPDEQTHQGRMEIREQTHGRILSRHERLPSEFGENSPMVQDPGALQSGQVGAQSLRQRECGETVVRVCEKTFFPPSHSASSHEISPALRPTRECSKLIYLLEK